MGRLPKGWKKKTESSKVIAYSKDKYIIYIWKQKKPKKHFIVEPFRKMANYKRRLFSKKFKNISEAKEFSWKLMKQKEIKGYFLKSN